MRTREFEKSAWAYVLEQTRWWNVTAEQREKGVKKIARALQEVNQAKLARDRQLQREIRAS